jgi:hypothetical protein
MKPIGIKKAIRQKMMIALTFVAVFSNCTSQPAVPSQDTVTQNAEPTTSRSIKLASLLDTSNSMDGLIDQAKSQLWSIVNELAKAKCDNAKPELRIALYEYGNSGLTPTEGYIRMVTPLTDDLDQISEDLFSLKTNGGQEFCGHVIQTAMKELQWSTSSNDYQVIFIAGNEPFTQGNIDYRKACDLAKSNGVIVNTIFCGNFNEGMNTQWKDGAILTGGNYSSIEQDRKTVYIESPYDKDIVALNEKLNKTYVYYGSTGKSKMELQSRQDANASTYGTANSVKRTVSKSSHVYKNTSWDLVDASKEKEFDISKVESEQLPDEMKKMSKEQRASYVKEKSAEREQISKQISELNKKREVYLAQQQKSTGDKNMLESALLESIQNQAIAKNFSF